MKKLLMTLSLTFALVFSWCRNGNTGISTPIGGNASSSTYTADNVSSTDSVIMPSQVVVPYDLDSQTTTIVDYSMSESTEDIIEDIWYVKSYSNKIVFTPDDYYGPVIDFVTEHANTNGKFYNVTFRDVAFISSSDTPYEGKYSDYQHFGTYTQSNGEEIYGKIFYYTLRYDFLEHSHDGIVDRFFLDINLPDDIFASFYSPDYQSGIHIIAQDENKVLMCGGSYIFTYDLRMYKTNLISSSALDYKYSDEGEFYFTDWDHIEYHLDWKLDDTITETGNKVIVYRNDNFDLSIQEDFEEEFLAIQAALRSGEATEETYEDKYDIYSSGSMYKVSENKIFANIHLPHAYAYNRNLIFSDIHSCWLIEGNKLTLYRFGEEVRSISLPDGTWKIIYSYMSLFSDPTTSLLRYIIDTNNDGIESPEEINDALTSFNIMLMNVDESDVYTYSLDKPLNKILTDVVDYREVYGKFYWMDSHGNAYCCDWTEDQTNTLIGKNSIGISPFTDEGHGFLVKPDDSRRIYFREGFPICLDWLNRN